jgi:hypothetical protein
MRREYRAQVDRSVSRIEGDIARVWMMVFRLVGRAHLRERLTSADRVVHLVQQRQRNEHTLTVVAYIGHSARQNFDLQQIFC